MQPAIVIFGKNGQVGYELNQRLAVMGNITALGSQQADFSSADSVVEILQQLKPDIIVNAAAHTAVDKAETESQLAYLINSETPARIAAYAEQNKCLFIHYSTDFVFDGEHKQAYLETDKTHPLGVYGASKLQGEESIIHSGCSHLIFRTSWVYGMRGGNFLLTMLRLAHQREQMKVVSDQLGSPVWCGHIAQTTQLILENLISNYSADSAFSAELIPKSLQGLYNLTASDYTSWFDFACKILELDPNKEKQICKSILPIPASEYPTPAQRPQWSVLNNDKIINTFAVPIPAWQEQLQECFNNG
ncbi:MAG: dTDP-4-dehydrorhamnose reductase [Pseudomonadota bacterium]